MDEQEKEPEKDGFLLEAFKDMSDTTVKLWIVVFYLLLLVIVNSLLAH